MLVNIVGRDLGAGVPSRAPGSASSAPSGSALNLLAVVLLGRRVRAGRTLSFIVSLFVALGAFVVLFRQSLDIAEGLDVFAGAFQRAFRPLILVAVGRGLVGDRPAHPQAPAASGTLVTDDTANAGAVRAVQWLMWAGLAIVAVGTVWWLFLMRRPAVAARSSATPSGLIPCSSSRR